ncbi:hypothetical protein ACFE04_008264 [Oxalis oulophora]
MVIIAEEEEEEIIEHNNTVNQNQQSTIDRDRLIDDDDSEQLNQTADDAASDGGGFETASERDVSDDYDDNDDVSKQQTQSVYSDSLQTEDELKQLSLEEERLMKNFNTLKRLLLKILELDPSNDQAKKSIRRLEPLAAEKREKMKEEMIDKLKDMGNSLLGRFGMSVDNFKALPGKWNLGKPPFAIGDPVEPPSRLPTSGNPESNSNRLSLPLAPVATPLPIVSLAAKAISSMKIDKINNIAIINPLLAIAIAIKLFAQSVSSVSSSRFGAGFWKNLNILFIGGLDELEIELVGGDNEQSLVEYLLTKAMNLKKLTFSGPSLPMKIVSQTFKLSQASDARIQSEGARMVIQFKASS